MFAPRSVARAIAATAAAVLAATLLPPATAAVPGPIHAGNTFGWYHHSNVWRQEFVGSLPSFWRSKGPGVVRIQHGMLTLNTASRGSVSATLHRPGHRTGRWEIRLRSRSYESAYKDYRVVTKLIPAGTRKQHCGGRDVALEYYRQGADRAKFYIHTLPQNTFRATKGLNVHNDQWHTFAVEVTKKHISWFVDAHVIRTERRSDALSGVPLTVRFVMQGVPGARMNRSRMQMDWLRYWSYNRPSTKSIKAPQAQRATFHAAC